RALAPLAASGRPLAAGMAGVGARRRAGRRPGAGAPARGRGGGGRGGGPVTGPAPRTPGRGVSPTARVHESSYVDEGAVVGAGTRIWHFCHVMPGAVIGERCNLG